ncbi:unnamed protein product [Arabidopsis halleri]
MWNIMDILMVVSKWTPFSEEAQPAMKSIQLWVTQSDVPSSMFTDKGLEFLSSAVGRPIRLHPKEDTCVRFDEAQNLVEVDLTKDLPKEYVIMGEEEGELDAVIKYSYPWLPPRFTCFASPGDGEEQGGDDQGWITPPRISRSPSKRLEGPKYGEASILSNTYSALSMVDEVRVEAKDEEEVGKEVELPTT